MRARKARDEIRSREVSVEQDILRMQRDLLGLREGLEGLVKLRKVLQDVVDIQREHYNSVKLQSMDKQDADDPVNDSSEGDLSM